MKPGENAEEVAVRRRHVGDARVTEQQREGRGKSNPEHQRGHQFSRRRPVKRLDISGSDELAVQNLTPGNDAQECRSHEDVERAHGDDREHDGAGNHAPRIADFLGEVAHVVVAEVVVQRVKRGVAEPRPENPIEAKGLGGKIEGAGRAQVRDAREYNPKASDEHATHQHHRHFADGPDSPIEQRDQQQGEKSGHGSLAPGRQRGRQIMQVALKPDTAARDRQRRRKHDLPDHQE